MFSKKMAIIFGVTAMLIISIVVLIVIRQRYESTVGGAAVGLSIVAPFQDVFVGTIRFSRNVWRYYFSLVSAARENDHLRKQLRRIISENNQCKEVLLANQRLRRLLNFHKEIKAHTFAAEVIAQDPSTWFRTIVIDKGSSDNVEPNMPVVMPEGIVGQVVNVSLDYSKVLLINDPNSAVDALCQRTRARGIVRGGINEKCDFEYVLRKDDVRVGDIVVSSGLDGVYPKGLRIGRVSRVIKRNSGIFQAVEVEPYVNFNKLEEVLVVVNASRHQMARMK